MPAVPPAPRLAGVTHRLVELRAAGVRLHVAETAPRDDPEQPPVVLVPTWPQSWWAWRKVLRPLAAAGHRVCAVDPRGMGSSPAPPGRYDTGLLAEDLIHLVDRLSAEPVVLAGHGWGAWWAWHAAARAPDRVARLVVLGTAAPRGAWDRPPGLAAAAPVTGGGAVRDGTLVTRLLRDGTAAPGARDAGDVEVFRAPLRDHDRAYAAVRLHRTFWLRERRAAAPALPPFLPVRRLVGARDPWVAAAGAEAVPDAGHFLPEEAPDAVLGALTRD